MNANPTTAQLELRHWVHNVETRADRLALSCTSKPGDWEAHRVRATLDLAAALDRIEQDLGLRLIQALFENTKVQARFAHSWNGFPCGPAPRGDAAP